MGQQQLLLLVLGIVIVGLAVVVGINAFSENRIKSNADALVTDGLRLASDMQAWALKPTQFGGGNDGVATTNDLAGEGTAGALTLAKIGYDADGDAAYTNVNGNFALAAPSGITCTAPTNTPDVTLYASNADTGNCVTIGIAGTSSNDIETNVTYGTGGAGS